MVFFTNNKHALLAALVAAASPALVASQQQIGPRVFNAGIESGAYDLVLDVRRQDEWDLGHVAGAIHVPNDGFEDNAFWQALVDEVNYSCNAACATIVTYCRSGGRAGEAIQKLRAMGFEGTLLNGLGVSQYTNAGFALTLEEDAVNPPVCATTDICNTAPPTEEVVEEEEPAVEEVVEEEEPAADEVVEEEPAEKEPLPAVAEEAPAAEAEEPAAAEEAEAEEAAPAAAEEDEAAAADMESNAAMDGSGAATSMAITAGFAAVLAAGSIAAIV